MIKKKSLVAVLFTAYFHELKTIMDILIQIVYSL